MKRIILCLLLLALILTGCASASNQDSGHKHNPAQHPQIVENPYNRTSETLEVTVNVSGKAYTFQGRHAITLTNLLTNLAYDPAQVCDCQAEYTADTQFGAGYEINLTLGFVRCDQGQAALTVTHIKRIGEVINWINSTGAIY